MWRRATARLAVALLCAAPAAATWSIVVVDTATGEVCVAAATCLPNAGLKGLLPVVRVGYGAASAQSVTDSSGANRKVIWDGFLAGLDPSEILMQLAASDAGHQGRQYGIVDRVHDPLTFTGAGAGIAKPGVAGIVGTLRYAIQGNVLTGDEVVFAAETALLNTPGDLVQRVMAGMEAARSFGGDGRCSCSISNPTGCGAPPPAFRKSSHSAFLVLSRVGDRNGTCNGSVGCANGDYFLTLKFSGGLKKPDPVLVMERELVQWRKAMVGLPDQVHSTITPASVALAADGASSARIDVELRDLDGAPVTLTGLAVEVGLIGTGPSFSTPGVVTDQGGGRFSFDVQAGAAIGSDLWRLTVKVPGGRDVTLQPDLAVGVGTAPPACVERGEPQHPPRRWVRASVPVERFLATPATGYGTR